MVLRHVLPRPLRLRAVRRAADEGERRSIVAWLESEEGEVWARLHFDDPTGCHDLIEIIDDSSSSRIADHASRPSDRWFRKTRDDCAQWADLTWQPDKPP